MTDLISTSAKMHGFETIDLESHQGDDYLLAGVVGPEPAEGDDFNPDEDAGEYAVSLMRATEEGPDFEIVRLENRPGELPRMVHTYRDPGADEPPTEKLDEGYTYEKMKQFLLTYWRDFVDGFIYYNDE